MTAAPPTMPSSAPADPGPDDPAPSGAVRTTVELLGSVVAIDAARPVWTERLRTLLAPFVVGAVTDDGPAVLAAPTFVLTVSEPDRGGSDDAVLARGATELARGPWASVEARLLVELNTTAIGGYAGFAVHAGAVARDDLVTCFPGESGLGKSTMTAACLAAGFDYVSDEALCIDRATARVVPFPRPIALSPVSMALLGIASASAGRDAAPQIERDLGRADDDREVLVRAESLGSRTVDPRRRLRLAHIVELRRGASEAHLEPLHRSYAVPALLSLAFNHFKEPDTSVDVVGVLAADVQVWRLHHDDPLEAAALLARALG